MAPTCTSRSWVFSFDHVKNPPSFDDGLSETDVRHARRAGCNHIQDTTKRVWEELIRRSNDVERFSAATVETNMKMNASTSMVLFNRFYMRHSFARHDRFLIATACVFLGFKIDDVLPKIKAVCTASWESYHRGQLQCPGEEEFNSFMESVLECERMLLFTLEFDILIDLPYSHLKTLLNKWKMLNLLVPDFPKSMTLKDAPREIKNVYQLSANYSFIALGTDICLTHTALEIAEASLFLAFETIYGVRNGSQSPIKVANITRNDEELLRFTECVERFLFYLAEDVSVDECLLLNDLSSLDDSSKDEVFNFK